MYISQRWPLQNLLAQRNAVGLFVWSWAIAPKGSISRRLPFYLNSHQLKFHSPKSPRSGSRMNANPQKQKQAYSYQRIPMRGDVRRKWVDGWSGRSDKNSFRCKAESPSHLGYIKLVVPAGLYLTNEQHSSRRQCRISDS